MNQFFELIFSAQFGIGEPEHAERFTRSRTPKSPPDFFKRWIGNNCSQQPANPQSGNRIPVYSVDSFDQELTCLLAVWSGLRDAITDTGPFGASLEELLEKT